MRYPNGLFGWADLSTTDVDAAKAFYSGLFGWTYQDNPISDDDVYAICLVDDKMAAGIGPMPQPMVDQGIPPVWNSYVMVQDADATCAAVPGAGGFVALPPRDVMTQGRMAMIGDPSGAVVGIWQPRDHEGADVFNSPGALMWNELQSRNLDAATPFYASLFGWRWEPMPDGSGYVVGHLDTKKGDDTSNCGALPMPAEVPAEVPSYWAVYFGVEDCEKSAAKVAGLGGTLFMEPMALGPGVYAGAHDSTGAPVFFGHVTAQG